MDSDDDDDVQVLSSTNQEIRCQLCNVILTDKSLPARQAHYERHFDNTASEQGMRATSTRIIDLSDDDDTSSPKQSTKKFGKTKADAKSPPLGKQNIFWNRSTNSPPPKNFTPGLIAILKQALLTSHEKGQTVRAALCYPGMVHVQTEWWDLGWGCGYRNFLMACTALIDQQVQPLYFPALDEPIPPGVRNLQQWIEDAWKAGYDREGAKDLKHKLAGTRKWIGTAELYVAFLSRGIPSRLVDFPKVSRSAEIVVRWIENYFSSSLPHGTQSMRAKVKTTVDEALRGARPVTVTDRMPIILQHEGHSRTIVGYERLKDGSVNLLCFDPARKIDSRIRDVALASHNPASSPASGSRHRSISPSKVINRILHPLHHESNASSSSSPGKKRRAEDKADPRDLKRVRGGLKDMSISSADVIVIDDDDDVKSSTRAAATAAVQLDCNKVLTSFRLKPQKVGKNDRYQILYFTLEDLLTEEERRARRVVTSEVIQ